jgi:peptidoglycan hydrolase-like protein with peptidoglycan-binding domain
MSTYNNNKMLTYDPWKTSAYSNNKMITYGTQGSDVTNLQNLLNSHGYNLDTDGIFGSQTLEAVKDYQQQNGLDVDGIVGSQTMGSLTNNGTKPSSSTGQASNAQATGEASADQTASNNASFPQLDPFTYDPFKVSSSTAAADQHRQDVASQKPGEFSYGPYEKSDAVKQAEALLQQHLSNKPGEYQSAWQAQLDDTLNKILNREKFSYDLNGDALYQQYKDQYTLQGQQAMMDTMGQAQAMTGGYANSYAQSVGQQTYQGYLQQLNDKIPELYQLALDQYNREGEDLYNQYGLFADRENQDYGRYRDSVADWQYDRDYLTDDARYQSETDYGRYMDQYNMEYGQHRDSVADWKYEQDRADNEYWNQYNMDYTQYSDDRNFSYNQYTDDRNFDYNNYWNQQNFNYQKERDEVSDQHWQAEFDEGVRQYNHANGINTSSSSSSSSSDNSSDNGKVNYDNGGYGAKTVADVQRWLGVTPDGKWGPQSAAAARKKGYSSIAAAVNAWSNDVNSGNNKQPQQPEKEPTGSGFTGSTYSEAAAYLKSMGLSASGLMTQSEWQRHKNGNNSGGGEHEADTYQEYLAAYIYGKTN